MKRKATILTLIISVCVATPLWLRWNAGRLPDDLPPLEGVEPLLGPAPISADELQSQINGIFARLRDDSQQDVTNLEVVPLANDRVTPERTRRLNARSEEPMSRYLVSGEGAGNAVDLSPVHWHGCGCCSDVKDNVALTDHDLAIVARVEDIRWLRLNRTQVTSRGIHALAHQTNMVWINAGKNDLDDRALDALGKLSRLKYLNLSQNKIDGQRLSTLAPLSELETLDLSGNQLTDEAIRRLPALPSLKRLVLSGNRITGRGLEKLAGMPALEDLVLSDCPVTGEGIATMPVLKRLVRLELDGTQVDDRGMQVIASQPSLRQLNLSGCGVTGAGLDALRRATTLEHLNLVGCDVGDDDLQFLKPLRNLQSLSMQESRVTGAGFHHVMSCTQLTRFDLLSIGEWSRDQPIELDHETAQQVASNLKNLQTISFRLPDDVPDTAELAFEGMPELRNLRIRISKEIASLSLRDLPKLLRVRVEPVGAELTDFPGEVPSPMIRKVSFHNLNRSLGVIALACGDSFEANHPVTVDQLTLTIAPKADISQITKYVSKYSNLNIYAQAGLDPEDLATLLSRAAQSNFWLGLHLPVFCRKHSLVIDAALPGMYRLLIQARVLEGERPIALGNVTLQVLQIRDADIQQLVLSNDDFPNGLSEIALDNVAIGLLHFEGCQCPLRIESAREFGELRVSQIDRAERQKRDIFRKPYKELDPSDARRQKPAKVTFESPREPDAAPPEGLQKQVTVTRESIEGHRGVL